MEANFYDVKWSNGDRECVRRDFQALFSASFNSHQVTLVYFVLLQNNLKTAPLPGVTDLINKQTYPETLLKGIIKVKKT